MQYASLHSLCHMKFFSGCEDFVNGLLRYSGRSGRKFAVVFGVVLAVAPVTRFVARQGGWVEFAFGRRDQIEVAAPVASPSQAGAHPHTAGQPAMSRDVADANADTAMGRPV